MRNLLIAAVGAVTVSALVACSDATTEPQASGSMWFSSNTETFDDNPVVDTWHPENSQFEVENWPTPRGREAENYCRFYSGLFDEQWEVGAKWPEDEDSDDLGALPNVGGFTFETDGENLDWDGRNTANRMRMVLVKGGNEHNLYFYNGRFPNQPAPGTAPDSVRDSGLHAPMNASGKPAAISHFVYCYIAGDDGVLAEGCTPGYWRNHEDRWDGYSPSDPFDAAAGLDPEVFGPGYTMAHAIWQGGGGLDAIARHGSAALLNAHAYEHGTDDNFVNFGKTVAEVQAMIADAIETGDHSPLAALNEQGDCPLSGSRAVQVDNPHERGGEGQGNQGQRRGR